LSTDQVLGILKKIPMFYKLNEERIKSIFEICSIKKLAKNDILCHAGDESNHIYILIAGFLRATLEDGSKLSRISPLWTIGEMGVFSGEKRSATVIAESECSLFTIHKADLFEVFGNDPVIGEQVAININRYLAHKLRINQAIIEELKAFCSREEYSRIVDSVMKNLDT